MVNGLLTAFKLIILAYGVLAVVSLIVIMIVIILRLVIVGRKSASTTGEN